ncbi:MAG TPA: 30S ribosomal protein S4e [Thermoplasmata archaeon]|nr:30S ribosomal protein S4e [Thermoplasmata archaeon]
MTFRLKRRAQPVAWKLPRKGTKWVKRPAPGPHPQEGALPILLVLRDVRRIARSAKEASAILRGGHVRVDQKKVSDPALGVGLMDSVSLAAPLNEHYRVLKDRRGKLILLPIPEAEAATKLGRVRRKTTVPGGRTQVTLHDGRCLLVPAKANWRVGDTLQLELPKQKVVGHYALAPGHLAYVSGGSHVGETAKIERIEVKNSPQPNRVHFAEGFSTIKEYVFVIGEGTPKLSLPEALDR